MPFAAAGMRTTSGCVSNSMKPDDASGRNCSGARATPSPATLASRARSIVSATSKTKKAWNAPSRIAGGADGARRSASSIHPEFAVEGLQRFWVADVLYADRMNAEKMTERVREALNDAFSRALRERNPSVEPEHVLAALLEQNQGVVPALLTRSGTDVPAFTRRALDARRGLAAPFRVGRRAAAVRRPREPRARAGG